MECCGHSSHKKMGFSASVGCSLVLGLGVICCRLHCIGAVPFEDQVYNNVAKSFDRQVIRVLPDLQKIIDQVMDRFYCGTGFDHNGTNCGKSKCLHAEDIFLQAGYLHGTEVLTPKTFAGVSVPLLAYALDPGLACSRDAPCLSQANADRLECWTKYLLNNRTTISEDDLNELMKRLSRNYIVARNSSIPSEEIIEAPVIFDSVVASPGSSIPSNQFPVLAALLVSYIFYGVPVAKASHSAHVHESHESNLTSHPTPDLFIASLFDVDIETGSALSIERLKDITRKLNIGQRSDHSHVHRIAKRHIAHEELLPAAFNKTCFPLDELRAVYNLVGKDLLTQQEFERLCPALIQQSYYDACEPAPAAIKDAGPGISDAQKYGYGTLAVIIISLLAVLGIAFLPLFKKNIYEYALQGFIALGVGTLSGDALLHLLPEALNLHSHGDHGEEEASHGDEAGDSNMVLWRCVTCLGAIYGFFLWEICLHSFIHHRSKRGKTDNDDHDHNHQHSHVPDPATFAAARAKSVERPSSTTDEELNCKEDDLVDRNHPPALADANLTFLGLAPLAWMILLGDSLHNFGDGLTIAAAFSIDISSGISTTIAIFCHEVPHELGDFAILLSTGMSFRKAMALNFLTSIACLGGFFIGIPIAKDEGARQWIFTVAAGMFLYIALADMLPELKNGAKNILTIVVQNIGLLTGFAIMLLIALYEDAIKI